MQFYVAMGVPSASRGVMMTDTKATVRFRRELDVKYDCDVQASIRVMPGCYITGQAAGAAAAMAAQDGLDVHALPVQDLQERLVDMGAFLPNLTAKRGDATSPPENAEQPRAPREARPKPQQPPSAVSAPHRQPTA